eukprot:c20498_g1_i1 orf=159-2075(+)
MGAPLMTVRAKFLENAKSEGFPGVLVLTWSKFIWNSNDPTHERASRLDVSFATIKGHRSSKETPKFKKALLNLSKDPEMKEGYMFEFENFQDRDRCRDLVGKILAKQQHEPGADQSGSVQSISAGAGLTKSSGEGSGLQSVKLNKAEMERRMKLLREDSELQKLHQHLVIQGILSEDDFWATRKYMLDDEASKTLKQRAGFKSAMLADVRPMTDGRTNKVTFNLTPEIIHQIFAEKPAVHQAFLLNVPSKMTEVEFWRKYCRAEYLHRTKTAAAVAAEAEEDEDLAEFLKDDEMLANEGRRKLRRVDPTVDMSADLADDYLSLPGHGILRDGSKETALTDGSQVKRTLLRDLNRHAAVVLEGRPLDTELRDTATVAHALVKAQQVQSVAEDETLETQQRRLDRVHGMTEIDDLQGQKNPAYVPLCIQDPRKYFDSQQYNTADTVADESCRPSTSNVFEIRKAIFSVRQQFHELKVNALSDPVIMPNMALKVLNDLTQYIANLKFQLGKNAEKNALEILPRNSKDDLLQFAAITNELLRHFWAAYPLTSVSLINKVTRLKDAMSDHYNRIQAMKESAPQELRHQISQLVQPMFQALDAAFAHYEADVQKRSAKMSQKDGTKLDSFGAVNGTFSPEQVAV